MTIFKDAFEKAGFSQKLFEARTIITNLMKGGLSASELIEIVHEVEETLSEGHHLRVQSDQRISADAQPPLPEGHAVLVREDRSHDADGQPIASGEAIDQVPEKAMPASPPAREPVSPMPGEGQQVAVERDQNSRAAARQPNSEPGGHTLCASDRQMIAAPSDRDRSIIHNQAPSPERMQAVRHAGHSSVATIFERFKCPDQTTPIGSVRVSDLEGWANSSLRFTSLFRRLGKMAVERGKLGPSYTVRDVLTAKELEKVIVDSGVVMEGRLTKGVLVQADGTLLAVGAA